VPVESIATADVIRNRALPASHSNGRAPGPRDGPKPEETATTPGEDSFAGRLTFAPRRQRTRRILARRERLISSIRMM
jgi:hypothetical protein